MRGVDEGWRPCAAGGDCGTRAVTNPQAADRSSFAKGLFPDPGKPECGFLLADCCLPAGGFAAQLEPLGAQHPCVLRGGD